MAAQEDVARLASVSDFCDSFALSDLLIPLMPLRLPQTFVHGTKLGMSCWDERYAGLDSGLSSTTSLTCVNGKWLLGLGGLGPGGQDKFPATMGLQEIERKNEQEIWFFNRMRLALATEVLLDKVHCMKFGQGDEFEMVQQDFCNANLVAEFSATTSSDSRVVKMLQGINQCMEQTIVEDQPIPVHKTCAAAQEAQQVPVEDMGGMLWRLHSVSHEKAGHRLQNSLVDCTGRGAVGKVDMEHLFNTNPGRITAFLGRMTYPVSYAGPLDGSWRLISTDGMGGAYPPRTTKMRACAAFTDNGVGTTQIRMKLQKKGAAGVWQDAFDDQFTTSYSNLGLLKQVCGMWHPVVQCGVSWVNTCQVLASSDASINVDIRSYDFEYGSDDPNDARTYRGVIPVHGSYDGSPPVNTWTQLNKPADGGVMLQLSDYSSASDVRACVTYTDGATQVGNMKIRLKTREEPGTVYFEDSFGGTWSAMRLTNYWCGSWHPVSNIHCGRSWTDTCKVQLLSEHGGPIRIYRYELELRSANTANIVTSVLGRMDLAPSQASAQLSAPTWQKISYTTGISIDSKLYPTATEFRLCVSFTDNDHSRGGLRIRIRRVDGAGGVTFLEEGFGETHSGNRLFHHKCGQWHRVSTLSCGASWSNTCQVDMMQTSGAAVVLSSLDMEYQATLPRDVCRFAPVISSMAQEEVEYFKFGTWPEWQYRLSDGPVYCPEGTAITDLNMTSQHLSYKCGVVAGLGSCMEWFSPQVDIQSWTNYQALGSLKVACKTDSLLNGFHFEFSEGGNWARFRYTCCKAAGAPLALLNKLPLPMRQIEGLYCPVRKDTSGRLEYRQKFAGEQTIQVSGEAAGCIGVYEAEGMQEYDVSAKGTIIGSANAVYTNGWASICHIYCDDELIISEKKPAGGSVLTPLDACDGATKLKIWGGGHCGGCRVADWALKIQPWPDQAAVLTPSAIEPQLVPAPGDAAGCDGYQVAVGTQQYDVSATGTIIGSLNAVRVNGWAPICYVYCDDELITSYKGEGSTNHLMPLTACDGATKLKIHGGGYCGHCNVDGYQLQVRPWSSQTLAAMLQAKKKVGENSSVRTHSKQQAQALAPKSLTFDPYRGRWCIGVACADMDGRVVPVGLSGAGWDVVEVSDFDGKFEGTGVPKAKGGAVKALASMLRRIKNPKRPKQPKKVKLDGYTPEEPTYAAECIDYGELWKNIQESYKDADGQVTAHMNKLEAEPAYQLPEQHPCFVAGNVSGTRGEIGGGDGGNTGTQMNYAELDGCAARVVARELETARLERDSAIYQTIQEVFSESMDLVCDTPPNVETAPMGIGGEFQPEDWCADGKDFAKAMVQYTNFNVGIGMAHALYNVEYEDNQDCDPMQAMVDRLFCDIHCVRDAVVRGDRAILRNLKAATDVTNSNMKKMVEWSVAANKAETGWLAAKIDTAEQRLGIRVQMVQETLNAQAGAAFMEEAKELSSQMLTELSGFAQAASFNALSRHTARDALEKFVAGAEVLSGHVNASRAAEALGQLSALHATLRRAGSGSRLAALGAQFKHEAEVLQEAAKQELQVLGIYKEHGRVTSTSARAWRKEAQVQEEHHALIAMDRIWWELRGKLDDYLEAAELQVAALQDSLAAMASYEHCSSHLEEVQRKYAQSLLARDRGHTALRATWRACSRLLGELASVVADGDVFGTFVQVEGCDSRLAAQTFRQARSAVGGMKLLIHRFKVAGLAAPDVNTVLQST
ncbi:unnamed protein product, partial [Symbiodinium natans]